jgi:hypothetical protein
MKIFCLLNQYTNPAVCYTLEFILNTCGYFYQWISQPISQGTLIIYGDCETVMKTGTHCVHIPCGYDLAVLPTSSLTWQEIKLQGLKIPVLSLPDSNHEIPFDLLATIYFHLARIEELSYTNPEEVDKNVAKQVLYRYGQFKVPVVDVLCDWFAAILDNNSPPVLRKAIYPSGQCCGVALTHDVDRLHAANPFKKWLFKQGNRFRKDSKIRNEVLDQADRRLWVFDRLLMDYQQNQYIATFFFLAKKMEGISYRYNIRSKKINELVAWLKRSNFEIALHASRYAFADRKRYAAEKAVLGGISGSAIAGLRQHYIRCLFPEVWRIAADIGFLYDASLVHRRMSGFRGGTAHPFYCFDHDRKMVLPLIECATSFFENTLPDEGADLEKSCTEIAQLFGRIKRYRGLMVALWHQHNIYENPPYPEIWQTFISAIDHTKMYINTLAEQAKWYDHRNKIVLTDILAQKHGWRLIVELPPGLSTFSLILPEGYKRVVIKDQKINYQQQNSLLCIANNAENRMVELKIE